MPKRIRRYFRGTASQVAVGAVLAIVIVVVLGASVVYDRDCGLGIGRGWDSHFTTDLFGEHKVSIHQGRSCLKATLRGDVEFSADEREVRRLGPGAYLEISERLGNGSRPDARRRLEVRPGAGGEPEYSWFVDRRQAELDDRARDWLQAALPRLFRVTGLDAGGRVGRLLAAGGLAAVLAEIAEIPDDHVQAIYFQQARSQAQMTPGEIAAWVRAAGETIGSDFELGRTLTAWIDGGSLAPEIFAAVLEAARTIGSDFELAALLIEAVENADRDPPPFFFEVLTGVGSDFEHARVLTAVADRPGLETETIRRVLESSGSIGSDFEQARLLIRLAGVHPITADLRSDYEHALASVGSEYERGRVREVLAADAEAEAF